MSPKNRTAVTILLLVGLACVAGLISWRPWTPAPDQVDLPRTGSGSQEDRPKLAAAGAVQRKTEVIEAPVASASPTHEDYAGSLPPCSIYGVVRRGTQLVGATIEVQRVEDFSGPASLPTDRVFARSIFVPEREAPLVTTVATAPDGHFEIRGLCCGLYDLRIRAEDGALQTKRVVLLRIGERHRADIVLRAGDFSLSGRVVQVDGRPWSGWVDVRNEDEAEDSDAEPVVFVAVDSDGAFVVRGLRAGSVSLSALEQGGRSVTRDHFVTLPHTGVVVFVVDERVQMRECLAIAASDRTPIPGASWTTWTHAGDEHLAATGSADGQGRFRIPVLAAGSENSRPAFVRVSARGFLPVTNPESATSDNPVTYALFRGAAVEGQITEALSHRPVAGATVLVVGSGNDGSGSATTDTRGHYEVGDISPGDALVLVSGGGWISANPLQDLKEAARRSSLHLVAGEKARRDIEVTNAPVFEGLVVDEAGLPVPGAAVDTAVTERQSPEIWRALLEAIDSASKPNGLAELRRNLMRFLSLNTSAGEDGRFRLDGLLPGVTYAVTAFHAGQRSEELLVALKTGEHASAEMRLVRRR